MTKHLMIDIETLATTPDAAILTVGAVKFNPFGDDRDRHVQRVDESEGEDDAQVILGPCGGKRVTSWFKVLVARLDEVLQAQVLDAEGLPLLLGELGLACQGL